MAFDSPGVNAFMNFPGIALNGIKDPAVAKAFSTLLEYLRRPGVITDQDAKQTGIDANTTHASSSGVDHGFIDQDVTKSAAVEFASLKMTNTVSKIATGAGLGGGSSSDDNLPTQLAVKAYVDNGIALLDDDLQGQIDSLQTQLNLKMANTVAGWQNIAKQIPTTAGAVGDDEFYRSAGGDVRWNGA